MKKRRYVVLKLFKSKIKNIAQAHGLQGRRTNMIVVFAMAVSVGYGITYVGSGTIVSAASNVAVTSSITPGSVKYVYTQLTPREAYPYYIAASFMVASGMSLYGLTYVTSRAERRSRYVSRFETSARTTY